MIFRNSFFLFHSKFTFLTVYLPFSTKELLSMNSKNTLVVFDLDYTLWPFWVDHHVSPPFKKNENGEIIDTQGQKIKYYPDVPKILQNLYDEGYILGIASRTAEIHGANQLVKLFGWEKYFTYKEIYPGCKVKHFNKFRKDSGIDFENMIFFDDESRNIQDITKLGVTAVYVKHGMTSNLLKEGLKKHKSKKD